MNCYDDLQFVHYGNAEHTRDRADKKRFAGYYGVQYNYSGAMELWLGRQKKETIIGPYAFISYPGQEFNYGGVEKQDHSLLFVCFHGSRVQKYLDGGLLKLRQQHLFVKINDAAKLFKTIMRLFTQLRQPGAVSHARAVLLLEEILLQINEQPELPEKIFDLYGEALQALQERLINQPEKQWNFQQEAAKIQLSYVHFRRLFQQITNMPPGRYLLECRLMKAEKLLLAGTQRVSEIAEQCGFDDPFHFSRIFKKHRVLAPLVYQKKLGIS